MSAKAIFPPPKSLELRQGSFVIDAETRIQAADPALGEMLAGYLRPATGIALPVESGDNAQFQDNVIILADDATLESNEAYTLEAASDSVRIAAAHRHGFIRAFQTLRQLLPAEILRGEKTDGVAWSLPALLIDDAPAFGWRGLMLDVARHMFSPRYIKRFIDLLTLHKFNTLHLHLTDDQGWRIEIKKYPRLTEVGAYRRGTCLPHDRSSFDGKPYGGFYTQDDIRELVAYAGERGITVVPEIELPGHSLAALASYPELGCDGGAYEVGMAWGIEDNIYSAGKDETIAFLKDVLDETLALFPSPFIHIGGDEAPKTRWRSCPHCQARIKAEGLADEDELQSWFVRQFDDWLGERGRRLIGWDEILEGGLAPQATVMSWRGSDGGIAAANAGHDVVMSPTDHCYLDYYQSDDFDSEPPALPRYLPLRQVYDFVVVPEAISPDKRRHILGGQGNIWTEYIPSSEQVEYMAYPRAVALAEVLWTHPSQRDYADFTRRLRTHLARLDALNVTYRPLDD